MVHFLYIQGKPETQEHLTLLDSLLHTRPSADFLRPRILELNSSVHEQLTIAYWVHSNIYDLGNIHSIRYLTVVDPFHSTSSAVDYQT